MKHFTKPNKAGAIANIRTKSGDMLDEMYEKFKNIHSPETQKR